MINIQNIDDNASFKWCIAKCFYPACYNTKKITKVDEDFAKNRNFKYTKFPVKVRDIHKIKKKKSIFISVFGCENKKKHPIYVLEKSCEVNHVDLL